MPELPGIFTRLSLDTTAFTSGVLASQRSLGDLAKSTEAFTAVNSKFAEMGNSIKNSGLVGASQSAMSTLTSMGNAVSSFVIGKGLSDLPKIMENAARAATAAEADQLRLKQAVMNTGASWESQSAGIDAATGKARSMGFAMGDVRASLANLVAITGNSEEAQKRLGLAMDLSRGTGLDLTTASKLLGKVTDENVNVLARYGIHMEKGASSTELFAAIQQKFGGQAATFANSATGQMEQYKATMGQVTAQLGQAFLPILQIQAQFMSSVMVPIVTQLVVPALKQIAVWSQSIGAVIKNEFMPIWRELVVLLVGEVAASTGDVGSSFKSIGDTIGSYLRPAVDVLRDSFKTIIQVFKGDWSPAPEIQGFTNAVGIAASFIRDTAYPAFMGLFTFISDNRQVIASVIAGFAAFAFLSTVAGWVAGLVVAIGPLIAGISGIIAVVSGGGGLVAVLGAVVAAIGGPVTLAFIAIGVLAAAWVNDWGGIREKTQAVVDFVMPYVQHFLDGIKQFWTDHGGQIIAIAGLAWDAISTHIGAVIRIIGDVFTVAIALWNGDWSGAWTAIQDMATTAWGAVQRIFGDAFAALDILTGGKLSDLALAFQGVWQAIKADVEAIWNAPGNILATVTSGFGALADLTRSSLSTGTGAISELWYSAWDGIHTMVETRFAPGETGSLAYLMNNGMHLLVSFTQAALVGDTDSMKFYVTTGMDVLKRTVDGTFGQGTGDTITGLVSVGWTSVAGITKSLLSGDTESALAYARAGWDAVKAATQALWAGEGGIIGTVAARVGDAVAKVSELGGRIRDLFVGWTAPAGELLAAVLGLGSSIVASIQNGISGALGGFWKWLQTNFVDKIPEFVRNLLNIHSPSGVFVDIGRNIVEGLRVGMEHHLPSIDDVISRVVGRVGSMSGAVDDWLRLAMQYTGVPDSWLPGLKWIVQHESGGDPHAKNPDSTASGLFQMIDTTWAGARDKSLPNDIFNPVINAVAGIRYIIDRYDDPFKAVEFWKEHNHYETGGIAGLHGPELAWVGEAGPEAVFNAAQMNWLGRRLGGGGAADVDALAGAVARHMPRSVTVNGHSTDDVVRRLRLEMDRDNRERQLLRGVRS